MADGEAKDQPDTRRLVADALPNVVAGAVIGSTYDLRHAITGAAAPALAAGLRALRVADERAYQQIAAAIQTSADELDVDPVYIEEHALEDPARTELLRRVILAAGRSTMPEKIDALGRVLAQGLDEATTDEALFLAAALSDLEAPHVKVLAYIERRTLLDLEMNPDSPPGAAGAEELAVEVPIWSGILPPVLEILQHRALVEPVGGTAEETQRWQVTDLGQICLALLRGKAEPRQP